MVVSLNRMGTSRPKAIKSKYYLNWDNSDNILNTCWWNLKQNRVMLFFYNDSVVGHGRWLRGMIIGTGDLQVTGSKSQFSSV